MIYLSGDRITELQAMPYYDSKPFKEALAGDAVGMARHCFDERACIAPPRLIIDKLGSYWTERYLWAIEQQKLTSEAFDG